MCHVALNYEQAYYSREDPYLDIEQRSYELPSGEVIEINHQKRLKAAEIIFNPGMLDVEEQTPAEQYTQAPRGIAQLALESIEQCDADLKICLYNNIVLAGGTTMMKGFPERFDYEIKTLADAQSKNADIAVHANLNRRNAAWIGGSMLASMSTFKDITLTNLAY